MRTTWLALSIAATLLPACSAVVSPDTSRLHDDGIDGGPGGGVDAGMAGPCPTGCDDGIACTVDVCAAAGCTHSPDHATCGAGELCGSAGCMLAPCGGDAECDDGRACNGTERCSGGACVAGEPVRCDDGVECTEDACDDATGACSAVPRVERCNDDVGCTRDACLPGDDGADERGCVHAPDDSACDVGCFEGATCDPEVGCEGGDMRECGDGNACTADRCEDATGCVHELRDDDGDGFPVARIDMFPFGSTRCEGGTDCDDTRPEVHPGAMEMCRNGRDDNCDGRTDEGCGFP